MKPLDPMACGRTLFYSVGNTTAALVERRGRRRSRKLMQFADAHAALSWCLTNSAAFLCFPKNMRAANN
ncbi:MAG TPA: hypothetical protein VK530_19275 [Candidatus Acidoferrum sp.]|nr:hypothetical protein [Candidatus Acidoferrum sp.]